jgi:hypothetical protein
MFLIIESKTIDKWIRIIMYIESDICNLQLALYGYLHVWFLLHKPNFEQIT